MRTLLFAEIWLRPPDLGETCDLLSIRQGERNLKLMAQREQVAITRVLCLYFERPHNPRPFHSYLILREPTFQYGAAPNRSAIVPLLVYDARDSVRAK
jgi:hypothetical protein